MDFKQFKRIWSVDFEFGQDETGFPKVICMVAKEILSGQTVRMFEDELKLQNQSPFEPNDCILAYYAYAEMSCFLSLGWNLPGYVIDLFAEFRNFTNGKEVRSNSLLGALAYFGISWIDDATKEHYRQLALRGGPYTLSERLALLDYCETDVVAAEKLFEKLKDQIKPIEAFIRGDYVKCIAEIERRGIPIDVANLTKIKSKWPTIKRQLIDEVNQSVPVFKDYKFNNRFFKKYLSENGYSWPYTEENKLDLQDDTFKDMVRFCPGLAHLAEVRYLANQLKLADIPVFSDLRTRCNLSPFGSKTGRNQPSTSKFIFGPSAWIRNLIKPPVGMAVAYIDWSQQEFGIAAALSGDENMKKAYSTGDPYLGFAKYAKAVPEDATKESHPRERETFKACVLAVQYGMSSESLAVRIQGSRSSAEDLLRKHKQVFARFWQWNDQIIGHAATKGALTACYGWTLAIDNQTKGKTVTNFMMQATGAEMLRHACIELAKANVSVCATVHDAILIEATADQIEQKVAESQAIMKAASEAALNGFSLSSDAKIFKYPKAFYEKRGAEMWSKIQNKIIEPDRNGAPDDQIQAPS